ncbi:MAG: serine/threonine protein kinase [Chloroflexota bacterium]
MSDLIGQSLGRYHILEQLGEGGMATVYKAYDTRLERDVAVKVIRSDMFGPTALARMLKRFEREAKSLARLSHLNIVKVLDYGDHEGVPYLVMEYLPGGTLKQKLGDGCMSWQESLRLLIPIAQALNYAHANKIVHRDIKPSNILITQTGEPMLSDFGIAMILEDETTTDLTASGVGPGTPEYMAPEQGMGQTDERADIYALGIVLYQMVTGRVPFRADTPMAILLKKSQEPLPRPRQFVPSLPMSIENLLIKMLARDPEHRYQTARDVTTAFERLLRGDETATEVLPSQPILKTNWMWIAAGIGALILFFTCLIGGIVLASNLAGGGRASPQVTPTPIRAEPAVDPETEAPFVFPSSVPPSSIPTAMPPTESPSLSDPAEFARWYFNALWTDRNYEYLWNNFLTPSFQNHSTEGKGYSDYVSWWSSVQKIDLHLVEVIQNDGGHAWIRVTLTFYRFDAPTLDNRTYDYNLTYNSQSRLWMFDYRK